MFPRVPSRSGGMVVVQTGILGTLVTGLAVSVARVLAPAGEGGANVSDASLAGGDVQSRSRQWCLATRMYSGGVSWALVFDGCLWVSVVCR